jgi:type I restriction enzyme S subunit
MSEINIPTLRFGEFTSAGSAQGEGEWSEKSYGDIYSFYTTNSFSRDNLNYEKGTVRNIHYGDIHTKFSTMFYLEKEKVPFINEGIELNKIKDESYCQVGDLVIADASEDYADIGKTMEIMSLNSEKTLAGLHTFLARPNKNAMALGYAGYLLQSWKIRKQVMRIAQGTKVLSLSTKRLADVILHIPTKPEQQKIATFLSAVDSSIEQLSKKEQLLRTYKKGVMQKIFSREIRFPLRPLRLDSVTETQGAVTEPAEVFEDWSEKKLGDVCQINPKANKLPDEFIYIDLESVKNGKLLKLNHLFNEDAPSRAQRLLNKQDILFQMVRPYQKNNYYFNLVGDYVASTGYAQIRAKESSEFLYHLLHTNKFVNDVLTRCTGTSYPAINSSDLSSIRIKIPSSLKEQTKIANFLSSIDKKIAQVSKQLEQKKVFKKGLLQQMFV